MSVGGPYNEDTAGCITEGLWFFAGLVAFVLVAVAVLDTLGVI